MNNSLELSVLVPFLLGFVWWWYRSRLRSQASETVGRQFETPAAAEVAVRPAYPRRYRWVVVICAAAIAVSTRYVLGLALPYSIAFTVLGLAAGLVLEAIGAERRMLRIEEQLVYALEIMAGNLRAGSGLMAAIRSALEESREPLRAELEGVLGRVMIGEDPMKAIQLLSERIQLDSFRFFTVTMSVHWESGGGIASTLLSVAKVIRDRIELMRRVRAESVEVQASVVSVTAVSYFLTYLLWRVDPESMRSFFNSPAGILLTSAGILLQATGITWVAAMSRFKY